jgi:hypothetical protein
MMLAIVTKSNYFIYGIFIEIFESNSSFNHLVIYT